MYYRIYNFLKDIWPNSKPNILTGIAVSSVLLLSIIKGLTLIWHLNQFDKKNISDKLLSRLITLFSIVSYFIFMKDGFYQHQLKAEKYRSPIFQGKSGDLTFWIFILVPLAIILIDQLNNLVNK